MSYDPQQQLMTSAYSELLGVTRDPVVQISAEFGITNTILPIELGGATSSSDGLYKASSGTGANNVAAVLSFSQGKQRPGQGLSCEITAIFNPTINNTQTAGLISSEASFSFGVNKDDSEFGVVFGSGGVLENQKLTITTPASGPENASVTVDGVLFSVPISAGTAEFNAYQIAVFLNANDARYNYTSNSGVVDCLALLPDFGGGAFSFSSSTAAANWASIKSKKLADEIWIKKSDWNVNPAIQIDPTKLNYYKIQVQGNIKFYVKDRDSGDYELVHIYRYLDRNTKPSVSNPAFRVGWATRNVGNTTDVTVSGDEGSICVEGKVKYPQVPKGASNANTSPSGTVRTNIISFRNRLTYQSVTNRASIIPLLLSLGTDSNKSVSFDVVQSPTVGPTELLDWQYLDEPNSLMEIAKNNVEIIGGTVISSFDVSSSGLTIEMQNLLDRQPPNTEFSIAGTPAVSSDIMKSSGTWKEDK